MIHVAPGAVQIALAGDGRGNVSTSELDAKINQAFRRLAAELGRR